MKGRINICKSLNVVHHIKRNKDKNLLSISIDTEKAFDKIQHTLMINALMKQGIERMYLNIMKAIYYKLIADIMLSGEKN
jgi:hypothetical protein